VKNERAAIARPFHSTSPLLPVSPAPLLPATAGAVQSLLLPPICLLALATSKPPLISDVPVSTLCIAVILEWLQSRSESNACFFGRAQRQVH
jgi:hypothetical protein